MVSAVAAGTWPSINPSPGSTCGYVRTTPASCPDWVRFNSTTNYSSPTDGANRVYATAKLASPNPATGNSCGTKKALA